VRSKGIKGDVRKRPYGRVCQGESKDSSKQTNVAFCGIERLKTEINNAKLKVLKKKEHSADEPEKKIRVAVTRGGT